MIKFKHTAIRIALIATAIIFILLLINYRGILWEFLYPIVLSFFLSFILNPIVNMFEEKGIKRTYSVLLMYLIFFIILLFIGLYVIPQTIKEIGRLIKLLPEYNTRFIGIFQYVQDNYSKISLPFGLKNIVNSNLDKFQNQIQSYLEALVSGIVASLSKLDDFALVYIILFYFLKDYYKITARMKLLIPRIIRSRVLRVSSNINCVFGEYIRSQIILSLIVTIMTTAALFLLKINFALIIGILNGITNIIPYFGPLIGAVPAVIIAFLQSPLKAVYTIIAFIVIQQVEGDIIAPKVMGDSVGLHPVTVIISLIIGGKLFGIPGMVLCIPFIAAFKIIYYDITRNFF